MKRQQQSIDVWKKNCTKKKVNKNVCDTFWKYNEFIITISYILYKYFLLKEHSTLE